MSDTLDTLPIRELERRRLIATNALADAVKRASADPDDREASVHVELHADAVRNYTAALEALEGVAPGFYTERSGFSFFADVAANALHRDRNAARRLQDQTYRSTTGAYGSLVVPAYLSGRIATSSGGARPLCDHLTELLPPGGMTITTSRVSSGATAEMQSAQNTAPTADDPVSTEETLPVVAVTGAVSVSWQLANRSEPAGFDRGVIRELGAVIDTLQEARVIAGDGTGGAPTGILNVTGVTTQALTGTTASDLLTGIGKAVAASTGARGMAPDTLILHPRRWAFLLAGAGDRGAAITVNRSDASPVRGTVMGLDAIVSPGIPTNLGASTDEDRIIVCRRGDLVMAEEPLTIQAERDAASQAAQLNMKVTGYRYFSVGAIAPASLRVLVGAGTVNPFA